jgi:hypothetical protein
VIDEFSRIENIKGQRARNVLTAAKTRRQRINQALATRPPGQWIKVDTLFNTMRHGNRSPTIARNDTALWKLYLVDPQYGSFGYPCFYRLELLEGRYSLAVVFEYAGALGLVDPGYIDPAGARDFRITGAPTSWMPSVATTACSRSDSPRWAPTCSA